MVRKKRKKEKKLDIDDEPMVKGECCFCGDTRLIYAKDYVDPYVSELYPEEVEDAVCGDWCENCWEARTGEI